MTKLGSIASQRESFRKFGRIKRVVIDLPNRIDLIYSDGNKVQRSGGDVHSVIRLLDRAKQEIIEGWCE